MATNRLIKFFTALTIIILGLAFIIKFAGPTLLRQYISYGIGDCKSVPILCREPNENVLTPEVDKEYINTLIEQEFPKLSISAPKNFTLVQELIKRKYYKKRGIDKNAIIYLFRQEPNDFIKLYPSVQKQGISDNYEFIRRLMYANLNKVNNITDAFFVIMKSVFTPDIGSQNISRVIKFKLGEKRGFVSYSMAKPNNFFDCNVLDPQGNFFKVYIKDTGGRLDLNNVFAIISTLKAVD